jgi:hypothetical protein
MDRLPSVTFGKLEIAASSCYHVTMASLDRNKPKKRATEPGELIGVRLQAEPLAKLDHWRREQDDLPGRPEAIRRLVEKALAAPSKRKSGRDG